VRPGFRSTGCTPRFQDRRLLDRDVVLGVCFEEAPPARERGRAGRALDGVDPRRPPDTGTLVMVLPRPPPADRRVAALEATPAPATTVVTPPRTARAPNDAPAPAALPPMLAPAPAADPIVRTTAPAGSLTTAGTFSCQTRTPYPATAPSNPATAHSSISTPSSRVALPPGRLHAAPVTFDLAEAAPASPASEETAPRLGDIALSPPADSFGSLGSGQRSRRALLPARRPLPGARVISRLSIPEKRKRVPGAHLEGWPHGAGPGLLSAPGSDGRQPRGRQALTTLATAVTRNNWPVRASSTARLWPGLVAGTRLP
jgi:hypothetical protein